MSDDDLCIHEMRRGYCGLCDPDAPARSRQHIDHGDNVARPGGYNADLVRVAIAKVGAEKAAEYLASEHDGRDYTALVAAEVERQRKAPRKPAGEA